MRHALITIVASFIGVLAGLILFYAWRDAADARARAASDAEQQARVARGQQLQERTLAEEREFQAIRNDVSAVTGARLAVVESYMNSGRMPASNVEAGLPAAATYKGHSLVSLEVSEGGKIKLRFDAASGIDGGEIEWLPDLSGVESMGVQWECATHDFKQIVRALPGCVYAAGSDVKPVSAR
jgi:hypothetical protein